MKKNNEKKTRRNFGHSASGILFNFKKKPRDKLSRREFSRGEEYSCDIELDDEPEINKKSKNELEFKPSTKQTMDKNKYKSFKKKYNIEKEYEIREEKEDDETKEEKKSKIITEKKIPPSRQKNKRYSEKIKINKVIVDDSSEKEELKKINEDKLNNSLDDGNNNNKNNKNYKIYKRGKSVGGDLEGRKNKMLKRKKK